MSMLEVRGVATFYGAIQALHGVDLDVGKGEVVTLIGANGAGKSTLLMTICGSPKARSGSIKLEGEEISGLPTHEVVRRGVAQVPEGRRIFPRMTVYENLQMGAIITDPAHFQKDLDRVFAMFPRLAERREQRGGTRPAGGQRQARSAHQRTADEPTAPAAARRAVAGPGAADRAPDLRRHCPHRTGRGRDDLPGRTERLPCPETGRS